MNDRKPSDLRAQILDLVGRVPRSGLSSAGVRARQTPVPVSGRVFDATDMQHLVDSSLDFWLTTGRFAEQFEPDFARFFGVRARHAGQLRLLGQPAGAVLPDLAQAGRTRLRPGDEVITVAAGFPTTVNPIIQNGLVPVFVDVTIPTYNVDVSQLEAALSDRTRAIMLAHTLGNPFDLAAVTRLRRSGTISG